MMERELTEFRKVYKRRVVVSHSVNLFYMVMVLVCIGMEMAGLSSMSSWRMVGCTLMLTILITGKNASILVLKDGDALRQAYLEETDERNIAIRAKAGQPVVQWLSVGLLMVNCLLMLLAEAAPMAREVKLYLFVAGTALFAAAVAQVAVSGVLKKYWEKRM